MKRRGDVLIEWALAGILAAAGGTGVYSLATERYVGAILAAILVCIALVIAYLSAPRVK